MSAAGPITGASKDWLTQRRRKLFNLKKSFATGQFVNILSRARSDL
jgi:hypothetical protein